MVFMQRLLEIVERDEKLKEIVAKFRLGDISGGKEEFADDLPLVYSTIATNPIVSKRNMFSSSDNKFPGQEIIYEFWIVIICMGDTPIETQKKLYEIQDLVLDRLHGNKQLRDKDGSNPLCVSSDIFTQKRYEKMRGENVEAMTIRVRPTTYTAR